MSDLESLAARPLDRAPLTEAALAQALGGLGPRWRAEAGELCLTLPGPMRRTGAAAAAAGALADELDHHPRIVLEYPALALAIHTHDAHAITGLDLVYAARLEQWLRANGW